MANPGRHLRGSGSKSRILLVWVTTSMRAARRDRIRYAGPRSVCACVTSVHQHEFHALFSSPPRDCADRRAANAMCSTAHRGVGAVKALQSCCVATGASARRASGVRRRPGDGFRVVRAAGVESGWSSPSPACIKLLAPMLDRLERLPGRRAMRFERCSASPPGVRRTASSSASLCLPCFPM